MVKKIKINRSGIVHYKTKKMDIYIRRPETSKVRQARISRLESQSKKIKEHRPRSKNINIISAKEFIKTHPKLRYGKAKIRAEIKTIGKGKKAYKMIFIKRGEYTLDRARKSPGLTKMKAVKRYLKHHTLKENLHVLRQKHVDIYLSKSLDNLPRRKNVAGDKVMIYHVVYSARVGRKNVFARSFEILGSDSDKVKKAKIAKAEAWFYSNICLELEGYSDEDEGRNLVAKRRIRVKMRYEVIKVRRGRR